MVIEFKKIYWTILPTRIGKVEEDYIITDHLFKTKKAADEYRKSEYQFSYMWKARKIKVTLLKS